MQKTKLGISVGLLGMAIYFTGLFDGLIVAVVLTGYILLFEENEWLKKNAVKAVSLMLLFSLIIVLLNLLPDLLTFIENLLSIFKICFNYAVISSIFKTLTSAVVIVKEVLFILLGIKALNQGTVPVPIIDRLINKYM